MKKFYLSLVAMLLTCFSAFATDYKIDESKALTADAYSLDGVTAVVTDIAGEKTWAAFTGGDGQDVNANFTTVRAWSSQSQYSYIKFYAAEGQADDVYYIKFVNADGDKYVPKGTWHDESGCMNVTGNGGGLFVGGLNNREGQDAPNGALWKVAKTEAGYTLYNIGKERYAVPGIGVTATETAVKLYSEFVEYDAEAEGDYSGRLSNNKADWEGATGVYGGGAERYDEDGCPDGDLLVQTIENLPAGKYEVKFNAIANVARDLDAAVYAGDGIAQAFANTTSVDVTVGTKAALDAMDWTNGEQTIECEVGEDGILRYGMLNTKTGGQWYVVKAISLTRTGDLPEPEPFITEAAMIDNGVETTLNSHSEVSVDKADAVLAQVSPAVRQVFYDLRYMMEFPGEESSQWIATDTIDYAEMSINGTAYAELTWPLAFEAGSKYMLRIRALDMDQNEESVSFIINGSYVEPVLANHNFAEGNVGEVNIATYAKDGTPNQMQEVPSWTIGVPNDDARAAGVVAYGSKTTLGGSAYGVPAEGPEGTNGNALAVVGVWNGVVKYVQNAVLPAGKYSMIVPVYNTAGNTEFVKNLIGVKYGETEVLATAKSYPVGMWTNEIVVFELEEETTVTVSLGYQGANTGSAASQHLFYDRVDIEPYDELAIAKIAAIAALPVGDESIFTPSAKAVEERKANIKAATSLDELDDLSRVEFEIPALKVQYVIYNTTAHNYLGTDNAAVKLAANPVDITFEPAANGFNIKAGEKYINMRGDNNYSMSADAEAKTAWSFILTNGDYNVKGPKGMIGADQTAAGSTCYGDKDAAKNGVWTIIPASEVASANMSVTDAEWATFCAPFEVKIPEGVTAYTTSELEADGATLVLESVETTIPANTPVILNSELVDTTFYSIVVETGEPTVGLLTGVYSETEAENGWYILQNHGGVVGFYQVETAGVTNVSPNRAYLTVGGDNAKPRAFFFDSETAIAAIEALTSGKAEIYNVNGVKINSLQKGINIVNGKKIMVK